MTIIPKTRAEREQQCAAAMRASRLDFTPVHITRPQAQAYAEFLLSEKIRHQEDIKAIDEKLAALARKGIVPAQAGPWIKTEDIEAAVIE